jgi:hypothetical protein
MFISFIQSFSSYFFFFFPSLEISSRLKLSSVKTASFRYTGSQSGFSARSSFCEGEGGKAIDQATELPASCFLHVHSTFRDQQITESPSKVIYSL